VRFWLWNVKGIITMLDRDGVVCLLLLSVPVMDAKSIDVLARKQNMYSAVIMTMVLKSTEETHSWS